MSNTRALIFVDFLSADLTETPVYVVELCPCCAYRNRHPFAH